MVVSLKNKRGFTLTEVLIGIMILTIAITAATNLLVNLRAANKANMLTLQAYYYAVSGIEEVRNIRDSNWLHNRDWLSKDSQELWGSDFSVGPFYAIQLSESGFGQSMVVEGVNSLQALSLASPFYVSKSNGENLDNVKGEATIFQRKISFSNFENYSSDNAVLVTSEVDFELNGKERTVVLNEVLTNWKDGIL